MNKLFPLLMTFIFALPAHLHAEEANQKIYPAGSRPSVSVNASNFTGAARSDPVFQAPEPARAYGAYVTFEPGARTNWHVHPLGQTLIVTSGKGLTQEEGKAAVYVRAGDVVVCPPNIKHWHGAAPDTAMTHLAISERLKDHPVQWLEKVDDKQYQQAAKSAAGGE